MSRSSRSNYLKPRQNDCQQLVRCVLYTVDFIVRFFRVLLLDLDEIAVRPIDKQIAWTKMFAFNRLRAGTKRRSRWYYFLNLKMLIMVT